MKKHIITLSLALAITSCASLNTVGTIPQGREKKPDLTTKYNELEGFDLKKAFKAKSNLDYQDFANKKCKDFGKKGYQAYIVGGTASSGVEAGSISFTTSETTNLKIWCK